MIGPSTVSGATNPVARSAPIKVVVVAELIERNAVSIDQDPRAAAAEALQGPTIDFVGVDFFAKGRIAANAVGRVIFRSGRAEGSGLLVAPGVFPTNHHVINTVDKAALMCVEFDYEAADAGRSMPVTRFAFDPATCFVTHPVAGLDFTLIVLGQRLDGSKDIEAFVYLPLSDAGDKHMLGEIANIIQHPNGGLKQVVVRENNLVARDGTHEVLHYFADTEKGSSGSPVCNNRWEAIALHHWGEPWLELNDADCKRLRRDVNEGIRISAIVNFLRKNANSLNAAPREVVLRLLSLWKKNERGGPMTPQPERREAETVVGSGARPVVMTTHADGAVSWSLPIEITVRVPLLDGSRLLQNDAADAKPFVFDQSVDTSAEARRPAWESEDFGDRGGYEPGFLPGFILPVPSFDGVNYRLALDRHAAGDDDAHELRYHHFSIF